MPPTSTDEQYWSERTLETYEFCRQIYYAVHRGDLLIDELYQIKEALAELDKRVAALKGSR